MRPMSKRGAEATPTSSGDLAVARCIGRSRGGLTTKIHALVDANGLPITLKLTEGQAHDGRSAADMLTGIGPGQTLLADRAYDSDAVRQSIEEQGGWANIMPMPGAGGQSCMPVHRGKLESATDNVESAFADRHGRGEVAAQNSGTRNRGCGLNAGIFPSGSRLCRCVPGRLWGRADLLAVHSPRACTPPAAAEDGAYSGSPRHGTEAGDQTCPHRLIATTDSNR
jgi:hypothetical protein